MSAPKNAEDKQLNIAIDEDVADGIYSNLAVINHSSSEFIVDFITIMPGAPKAKVKSRVILTPEHAKRFQNALKENIDRFEKSHGEIPSKTPPTIPMSFGPTGEA